MTIVADGGTRHRLDFPIEEYGRRPMREDIEKALEEIRPALQADGGDVEFVDYADGVVSVRLQGACGGCPMATMTLKNGIERILREKIEEVTEVVSV
jgi:Fe-S cluster biogenesis protein NfuA